MKKCLGESVSGFPLLEQMIILFHCVTGSLVPAQLEFYFLDLGAILEIQFSEHLLSAYQVCKVRRCTRHPLSSKEHMSKCPQPDQTLASFSRKKPHGKYLAVMGHATSAAMTGLSHCGAKATSTTYDS